MSLPASTVGRISGLSTVLANCAFNSVRKMSAKLWPLRNPVRMPSEMLAVRSSVRRSFSRASSSVISRSTLRRDSFMASSRAP